MNAHQILAGLGWSAAATAVNAVCQVVFLAVLARLLDPAAFGLMAMATIALRFASFFSQLGLAQALIQRPQIDARDTTAAAMLAVAIGATLYALMLLTAPLFAAGFHAPELVPLIAVLGLSLLLGPVGGLPLALLRRQAQFRSVNMIEVASYVVGYGAVGIACASRGLGVWSLVAASLSQQFLLTALGLTAVRYPLTWPVPRASFAPLWHYGARQSTVGFLEFLTANVETLFIGRSLGQGALGLFNRAIVLTNLPVEQGVTAINKVLFPALAGMQGDRARLADGFQMLLLAIGLLSVALACGMAAAAPDVVALLLGPRWAAAAPIVAVAALAVPPMFMFVACGVTLDSLAALDPKLRLQAGVLVIKVALVIALASWGLVGIAWAVVIAEVVRLFLGVRLLARLLPVRAAALWGLVALLALIGSAVWASVAMTASLAADSALPLPARVLLEAMAGAVALAVALLLVLHRFPGYRPVQRFDTLRQWHARLLRALHVPALRS